MDLGRELRGRVVKGRRRRRQDAARARERSKRIAARAAELRALSEEAWWQRATRAGVRIEITTEALAAIEVDAEMRGERMRAQEVDRG